MIRMEASRPKIGYLALVFVNMFLLPAMLLAGDNCCSSCGKQCESHTLVECTIMCPVKVIETRLKPCVTCVCEEREEKYLAFKVEPEERVIKKECCYLLDEVKSKEITEKDCQIVDINVAKVHNIKVPQYEMVEVVRQKEICTECGPMCVEETCLEERARMVDDICVEQACEKQLIMHETKKEIFYCVKTPKKQTLECTEETAYKLVPVQKTRKVMVDVPKIEYKPYEVVVTKNVPKKVICCQACANKHHRHHRR